MAQANINLGVLHNTKLSGGIYAQESAGYRVVTSDAPSQHCGVVAILYWEYLHFAVEAHQQHVPNIISFQMVTGDRNWFVVG